LAIVVAVEGLPGCGKTTIIELAVKELIIKGLRVGVVDIETVGDASVLRSIARKYPLGHKSRIILFWLLRLQQYDFIQEMKHNRDIIFADRFWGSTIAFDIYGNGVPLEVLSWVGENIQEYPDMTLFFSAPLQAVRERKKAKTMQKDEFALRVEQGYNELAREKNWTVIDATQKPDKVLEQCLKEIFLKLKNS